MLEPNRNLKNLSGPEYGNGVGQAELPVGLRGSTGLKSSRLRNNKEAAGGVVVHTNGRRMCGLA